MKLTQCLPVPAERGFVLIPFPMTEPDYELLLATLELWKKRLVANDPTTIIDDEKGQP